MGRAPRRVVPPAARRRRVVASRARNLGIPAELEAEVEAETRALLAARAASAAAASTAPSIPTFFRPKSDVGFLAAELRNIAHRVALQYKERGLLEDDELEALWNAIT